MRPSQLLMAVAVIFLIFIFDVMILWILKKIGGTPKTEVKASVEKFGGSLTISSAGLIGSFIAIAILVLAAIHFIARLIGR